MKALVVAWNVHVMIITAQDAIVINKKKTVLFIFFSGIL